MRDANLTRRRVLTAIGVSGITAVAGCSGIGGSNPEEIVTQYAEAIASGDIETVRSLIAGTRQRMLVGNRVDRYSNVEATVGDVESETVRSESTPAVASVNYRIKPENGGVRTQQRTALLANNDGWSVVRDVEQDRRFTADHASQFDSVDDGEPADIVRNVFIRPSERDSEFFHPSYRYEQGGRGVNPDALYERDTGVVSRLQQLDSDRYGVVVSQRGRAFTRTQIILLKDDEWKIAEVDT